MKIKDLVFTEDHVGESNTLYSVNFPFGRLTVLNRLTGYGDGIRDTETGWREGPNTGMESDNFWLASGGFDIRHFPDLELENAIAFIKQNANTVIPKDWR